MGRLVFTYGVMGSSKTAQALITRYNYIQKGFKVLLAKPAVDTRFDNEERFVTSRIGIKAPCVVFSPNENMFYLYVKNFSYNKPNLVIIDEAQFLTEQQVNELKALSKYVDVFCYGLKTNFKSELFEGSKRLVEIADELEEITYICRCGKKASINARFVNGKITNEGDEILIGDTNYEGLCYNCWQKMLEEKK
ncbi:MAG: thymidine kinase [Clostridia bacterium]|nr:thymidine kinase [Clostridia bacterium]